MKQNAYSRRPKQLNANMNVVPYIDVMLVLLVIFMVTTPMMKTGVDVDLPQEQTQNLDTGTQMPVIVSMSKSGELFINYDMKNLTVTNDQLISTLQQIQNEEKTKGSNIQVMVNADQTNQYGDIMGLMANIQQAGIQKVGLLTGNPLSSDQQ